MKKIDVSTCGGSGKDLKVFGKTVIVIGVFVTIILFIWGLIWVLDGWEEEVTIGRIILIYSAVILLSSLFIGFLIKGIGELVENSHIQIAIKKAELENAGFEIIGIEDVSIPKEDEREEENM